MNEARMKDFMLRQGLILGLVEIVILLVLYVMGMEWMTSIWMGLTSIVVVIAYVTYSGLQWRKQAGGYIKWGASFLSMMGVYAVGQLLYIVFNILLYHVINPELPGIMHEAIMDATLENMERWNMPAEQVEETMMQMQARKDDYSIPNLLLGYGWSLIFGALISAVIALFIRKKEADA